MAKYEGQDHYLDPETGVLRNRLGITDESELEKAEASFVAWRSYELSQKPIAGHFDLAHLQAIHRHLFGDVYDWAGEIRTIDLSKGNSYFANHARIVGAASPIFEKLAKEQSLKGLDTAAFSERAAYYLGEINALHPFREGNGRAPMRGGPKMIKGWELWHNSQMGVDQAVVSPAAISITAGRAGCSYRDRTDHTG